MAEFQFFLKFLFGTINICQTEYLISEHCFELFYYNFYPLNRVLQVSLIRLSKVSLCFPESMYHQYPASKIWEFKVPPGSIMPNKFGFLVFIMRMVLLENYHVHKIPIMVGFSDSTLLFEVFLSRNIDLTNIWQYVRLKETS